MVDNAIRQITCIRRGEESYPDRLRGLEMAPELLWVRGEKGQAQGHPAPWVWPWDSSLPSVAIVGSRAASVAGQELAFCLGRDLSAAGIAVVSGGALGIDAAAHRGALAMSAKDAASGPRQEGLALHGGPHGPTLLVMGTGVDVFYPLRHEGLFDEVARRGCLLSTFPLGTPAKPWHFPARNRLIAALSDVVVVVESQLGSGSRSTALWGRRLGKIVAAVTGSPGTSELIREGALRVRDAAQVLGLVDQAREARDARELGGPAFGEGPPETERQVPLFGDRLPLRPLPLPRIAAGPQADQVLLALGKLPCDLGELSAKTGLSPAACAKVMVDLELSGFCTRITGGRYVALPQATQ